MRLLFSCFLFWFLFTNCNQTVHEKQGSIVRNGVNIAYNRCGDHDTTLLFIHGWCINKEYWEQQVSYFCSNYNVVTIDLPGFGQSGNNRTNWSFEEYTEDIRAVIDQLQLKNVILIGHSMSGDLVLNFSNKYPTRLAGIVGVDNLHEPGSAMTSEKQKAWDAFFGLLSSGFDSTVKNYMTQSLFQPSTDTSIINRVMNNVYTSDSSIAISVLRSLMTMSQQEQFMMQGLNHKLYLVNSDAVPVKSDSLARYCAKGFQVELVHATGHYPMVEKPAEFNAALQKVINAIGQK